MARLGERTTLGNDKYRLRPFRRGEFVSLVKVLSAKKKLCYGGVRRPAGIDMVRIVCMILCYLAYLNCVVALANNSSTGTFDTSAVILDNESSFGVCVYPTSVSMKKPVPTGR